MGVTKTLYIYFLVMLYNIVILYMKETGNSRTGQNIKKKVGKYWFIHPHETFIPQKCNEHKINVGSGQN